MIINDRRGSFCPIINEACREDCRWNVSYGENGGATNCCAMAVIACNLDYIADAALDIKTTIERMV